MKPCFPRRAVDTTMNPVEKFYKEKAHREVSTSGGDLLANLSHYNYIRYKKRSIEMWYHNYPIQAWINLLNEGEAPVFDPISSLNETPSPDTWSKSLTDEAAGPAGVGLSSYGWQVLVPYSTLFHSFIKGDWLFQCYTNHPLLFQRFYISE